MKWLRLTEESKRALGAYALTALLSIGITTSVLQLWRADLAYPFIYAGDAMPVLAWIKGVVDNGWIWHNDYLGMPTGSDMHDFPSPASFHFLIMKGIAQFTGNPAKILNLYFLLTFPATALCTLAVFRHFNLNYPAAVVGSLLFTFLPYHFVRGEVHVFLGGYYMIPLMVMVVLWVYLDSPFVKPEPDGIRRRWAFFSLRSLVSVAICFLTASSSIYYAVFGAFFLMIAGLAAVLSRRKLHPLGSAVALVGMLAVGTIINLAPGIKYRAEHGVNYEALARTGAGADTYGLRIAQLLLPVSGHRLHALAQLKAEYMALEFPLKNDFGSNLGVIGSLGFLGLLVVLMRRRMVRGAADTPVDQGAVPAGLVDCLSLLNIFAVMLATLGGFSSIVCAYFFRFIRCYDRMSIYIGFFCLFAVAVALHHLWTRYARARWAQGMFVALFIALVTLGVEDQTRPADVPHYERIRQQCEADKLFVRDLESSLPPYAMVFEAPYAIFPEATTNTGFDLLRPYLYSRTLRWSYGAMVGREADVWQRVLYRLSIEDRLEQLALLGFRGIYLHLPGYADNGAEIEAELTDYLGCEPKISPDHQVAFYDLQDYSENLKQTYTPHDWQEKRQWTLATFNIKAPPEVPPSATRRWKAK